MKRKVLVVDDSELVLEMIRDALEGEGYEVFTAASGIEANRFVYSRNRPDLILLDVMLPLLNGDRKVRLLKESALSRDIPVLLISSKTNDELEALVKESGADGYIRKPFSKLQMLERVEGMIQCSGARDRVKIC